MRRVLVPLATLILGVAQIASGGCSASSELYGGGGCEAFCTKWVGAHCRRSPLHDDCMKECLDEQNQCPYEKNALLRCATLEANIACETSSGEPRIVGCAPRMAALAACLGCAATCREVVLANCPGGPTQEECVAACTDTKCASAYQRLTDCNPGTATCSGTVVVFDRCPDAFATVQSCVFPGRMFHVPTPSDAGADGDARDTSPDTSFGVK